MAAWHLGRCLNHVDLKTVAARVGLSSGTLSNIYTGAVVDVPFGLTAQLRDLEKKLAVEFPPSTEWQDFMEDPEVRMEVARLRQMNPKVHRARLAMAERAAKSGSKS